MNPISFFQVFKKINERVDALAAYIHEAQAQVLRASSPKHTHFYHEICDLSSQVEDLRLKILTLREQEKALRTEK